MDGIEITDDNFVGGPSTGITVTDYDLITLGHRKYFQGIMDEVQIYKGILNWFELQYLVINKGRVPYGSDLDNDQIDDYCDNCPAIKNTDQSPQDCCLVALWRFESGRPSFDYAGRRNELDVNAPNVQFTNDQMKFTDFMAFVSAHPGLPVSLLGITSYSGEFAFKIQLAGTMPANLATDYVLYGSGSYPRNVIRSCPVFGNSLACNSWDVSLTDIRNSAWTALTVRVRFYQPSIPSSSVRFTLNPPISISSPMQHFSISFNALSLIHI